MELSSLSLSLTRPSTVAGGGAPPPSTLFTALDASGVSYAINNPALDAAGSTYTITATVLDASGNSYNLI